MKAFTNGNTNGIQTTYKQNVFTKEIQTKYKTDYNKIQNKYKQNTNNIQAKYKQDTIIIQT